MILLDTHVLIWLDEGASALGDSAREQADDALQEEALAVSALSFWEIAMLGSKGRLGVRRPVGPWRRELIALGIRELPVDGEIAVSAGELEELHGDPADRMIIATALHHGARLMTANRKLLSWVSTMERIDARL